MRTATWMMSGSRVFPLVAAFALMGLAYAPPAPAAQEDTWTGLPEMPTPRRLLAAAALDKAIYTFGGCGSPCFDPPLHTSTLEETRVEVYAPDPEDPTKRLWIRKKPMPMILFGAAAAAVEDEGKIYLLGGYVTGSGAYEYDPGTDSWARKAPMPTPRHGLAAVALDGKVYVVGGSDGTAPSNALEVYDPKKNSWERLAPMPTPRVFLAAAALDHKIYAIGGSRDCCGNGSTNAVEIYDPAQDCWHPGPPLRVALQVSAAAAANGKIYVLGGFIPGSGVQGSTFEYDPMAKTWTDRATMLDPRDQAPAVFLAGNIHVVGGSVDCHCKARGTHSSYTPIAQQQPPGDLILAVAGPASLTDCEGLDYTFTVTNKGQGTSCDAALQVKPPPGSELLSISGPCDGLPCQLGDLAPGETVPVTARLSVPAGLQCPASLTIQASLTGCDSQTKTFKTRAPCLLSVTKTDGLDQAAPGDPILYTITVENRGCAAVAGAAITDVFPPTLLDTEWCRGEGCPLPSPPVSPPLNHPGPLVDTLNLAPGGKEIYRALGTVSLDFSGILTNKATVKPPGSPPVSATDRTRIVAAARP